ncbi:MAG: methyltransferase domain-containing protein [Streptomycetaceae bacterium]|nr:methyltransferase domain-containing protein [Streptomycetaceae bacterium]
MPYIVNTEQADAWNGYEGTHWADNADRYNAVNGGLNGPLLEAADIGRDDRVLDIGCGTGLLTRLAARRAARGRAFGLDLSAPMLARARAAAAEQGVANVAFEQGDAQVHPFPAAGFDVAVSRAGVMFFADPVAAFANIRGALRPGGRLAFTSLRGLADLGPVLAPLDAYTAPDLGPSLDGSWSLSDPDMVHTVLTEAGFTGVLVEPLDVPQVWGRDAADAAAFLCAWGPVRRHLDRLPAPDAAQARTAIAAALRRHEHPGAVHLHGAAWRVTATRPA